MKRWLFNVLIIIFSAIFLISGYFLLDYFLDSRKQKNQFDDLAALMEQATVPTQGQPEIPAASESLEGSDTPDITTEETIPQPVLVPVVDPETGETVEVLPEFAELYAMNNDIVGWMTIEDTNINYPVMQTPDSPNYYLYLDFNEEYSRHGCLYVREVCDVFAPSDNLTIYGHRMGDGTMFNDLHKYVDKDFWQTHKYITFNTLTSYNTYEILYVFKIASSLTTEFQYHLFVDAATEAEFDEFIANCQSYALYDTGLSASYGDKLITLSTCEYSQTNGRLVVVAKHIDAPTATEQIID